MRKVTLFFIFLVGLSFSCKKTREIAGLLSKPVHEFKMDSAGFQLDGKPFQLISGELHYARIPKEYWRHRIQVIKAMGCNSISTYVFWNYHETEEGRFDFTSENRDLRHFLELAKEEGMWVLLRPGPYVCAEWDFGGLPAYLLTDPGIKIRCMNRVYMKAVTRYISRLSSLIHPYLIENGGPIILLQIENEYGSYGNDRAYMEALKEMWEMSGIDIPFYTADGATKYMLEAGSLQGCAVGLDPGYNENAFDLAKQIRPNVPVFSSETYPGWLTHWGEEWARPDTANLYSQVRFLLENKHSVNFFMLHGGTNFAYWAGANSGGHGYQPDVTSYDYDAPINEQGRPTHKYYALRNLICEFTDFDSSKVIVPEPIPAMELPEINLRKFNSIWNLLANPIQSAQPKTFEFYKHYYGFGLYRTKLYGHKSGRLKIEGLHDFACIFLNGEFIGTIDRSKGETSIELPVTEIEHPVLDVLVEAMGRINYGEYMIDRKGITRHVSLNGMTLMNWEFFALPLDKECISALLPGNVKPDKSGMFFKGSIQMDSIADTFIDMSELKKGLVWVNGNNLGRYWDIGPQKRLYCPKSFLKEGINEIIVFDLLETEEKKVWGMKTF